jgi:phenylpyruvate tautomerase PptA (4-oxalocrotonate tautomerase family)
MALAAEDRRVTVRVMEVAPANVDLPSCRTERMTVVDVLLYEGRTPEMKAATAAALRAALAADPGIEPSEVAVFFHDATPYDLDVLPGQADL